MARWTLAWLAPPLASLACAGEGPDAQAQPVEGGQTGSAGCDQNPPDCVCDVLRGASLLRGVVTQSLVGFVRVEVKAVFGATESRLVPGAEIGGSFLVGQPCGAGDVAPPRVGLEVFAAWLPGSEQCSAHEQCALACSGEAADGGEADCVAECRRTFADLCAEALEDPLLRGTLQLLPFEDPLPLTSHLALPAEDFEVLLDAAACREYFVGEEPFTCHEELNASARRLGEKPHDPE